MHRILKDDLRSPKRFAEKFKSYVSYLREEIHKNFSIAYEEEELGDLLLYACRSNDFEVVQQVENRLIIDEERVWLWISEKLVPNTLVVRLDDEDVMRLLIFSFQMTYEMFAGGTRATVSAKGFRERRRTFESIVVDHFIGKFGEIVIKKFLEDRFKGVKIELDWGISRRIEEYRNDILNANKRISIKTTPALAGVWAEADKNYDYGILVKCSVPQPIILQFFIEVCGFSRLVEFVESKIPPRDTLFQEYLTEIKNRIEGYKCGEIRSNLKGIICGYFKTSPAILVREGTELEYLGKVREERYIINIKELRWREKDWEEFLLDVGLLDKEGEMV